MQNDQNNNDANRKPGERASNDSGAEVNSGDGDKLGSTLRDVIGVGVSGILAGVFFSIDHKIAGILFSVVTLAASLHIVTHSLSKTYPEKRQEFEIGYWVTACLMVILVPFTFPELPLSPKLSFALTTTEHPARPEFLTNDFLTWDDGKLALPVVSGHLVVPMKPEQVNILVNFSVFNKSPSATADNVGVRIFIADNLPVSPGPGRPDIWRESGPPTEGFKTLLFRVEEALKEDDGKLLPDLIFTPGTNLPKILGPIFIEHNSETTKRSGVAFYLVFATYSVPTPPFVVLSKHHPDTPSNVVEIPTRPNPN